MTLQVALEHRSDYHYDRAVQMGPQVIRLRPAPHSRTPIISYSLQVSPQAHFLNWIQDPHGNYLARVMFPERVREFHVAVDLVADLTVYNPFDFFLEPEAEHYPFTYADELHRDLAPYLHTEPAGDLLRGWIERQVPQGRHETNDFLVEVNRLLAADVRYVIRMEPGIQPTEQTLQLGSGSCRDSSWLLVQILRHCGIACRFVSGYLIQLVADVAPRTGPAGPAADFTDLHAWVEAYLPGAGWVGLDPTSGLLAAEGHIPLACTPDASSAAPISGWIGEAETEFEHSMSVQRVAESPRVTKPYSETQWQAIDALGAAVDAELETRDVRLTIGGEPTFVAEVGRDAPEWNTEATGPTKRALAEDLVGRLWRRFARGGLLHHGQGKWYPGEQLPRWTYSLFWRHDGEPLWRDPALIAEQIAPLPGDADGGAEDADGDADSAAAARTQQALARDQVDAELPPPTGAAIPFPRELETARELVVGVAQRLAGDTEAVQPAYEDPLHYVHQERQLPENVEAASNQLQDPMARARLAAVMERGLGQPTGFVLPLQRWQARDGRRHWTTERWTTRSGRLYLTPGDSPIGFRLPLDSLPMLPPRDYPYIVPADPLAARSPLPPRDQLPATPTPPQATQQPPVVSSTSGGAAAQTLHGQEAGGGRPARAALTVEPRDGLLYVFMPPAETVEDYVDLLAAVEDTAVTLGRQVRIEGYDPPADHRLGVIKVAPDPGVLEVNIHPAHDWAETVAITSALYEEASACGLSTEKFMVDGRHTGTGGGNHVVVGGASPADSPFLRRPDLLRSLIAYWQHHPSLSYLFSGVFIGPTSQAPRIDEARHDSLHELELAFRQVPEPSAGPPPPPWLVDRIFRNLLIDVTGNTHRAEICIDKLYSPDGPSGRLGLVELRAFEMPPHPRMSLVQQLLVRALMARFWHAPYNGALVRWGTQLHDRFMLPHFVWQDFREMLDDMNRAGYPLQRDWFDPHYEFRFPRYGEVRYDDVHLELRHALEPWPVMGEQGVAGGTARNVDSSVERLQVRATGLNAERYLVGCNGHQVPLTATGVAGEAVGGVRFRAWRPASSLHPTIGIDSPLVFDLYDRWSGRAVTGCTYHVTHPGGRHHDDFPVNALAAESRRLARFAALGHTPGPAPPPIAVANPEFPHTLDLRWSGARPR